MIWDFRAKLGVHISRFNDEIAYGVVGGPLSYRAKRLLCMMNEFFLSNLVM